MSLKTMMAEGDCSSAHRSSSSFSSVETTHFCGSLLMPGSENEHARKSQEMFRASSLVVNRTSYQSLPVQCSPEHC